MLRPIEAAPEKEGLSLSTKVHLFWDGQENSASYVAAKRYENLSFDTLIKHGVTAYRIHQSGLRMTDLESQFGVTRTSQLTELGYNALYLSAHDDVAADLLRVFSRELLVREFLCTVSDAVDFAGSYAATILGISTGELLRVCAGETSHCESILSEQFQKNPSLILRDLHVQDVLESGLRGETLVKYGITCIAMLAMGASQSELRHLNLKPML